MHVLRFGNKLNEEVCSGFIFANLFNSLYISMRLWWNILMANLATNFQDLVAKVKNVVTLAPVLGAIWRPLKCHKWNMKLSRATLLTNDRHDLLALLFISTDSRFWGEKFTSMLLNFSLQNDSNAVRTWLKFLLI